MPKGEHDETRYPCPLAHEKSLLWDHSGKPVQARPILLRTPVGQCPLPRLSSTICWGTCLHDGSGCRDDSLTGMYWDFLFASQPVLHVSPHQFLVRQLRQYKRVGPALQSATQPCCHRSDFRRGHFSECFHPCPTSGVAFF